jgi:membrane protein YdbS with pleckstrin-like domain
MMPTKPIWDEEKEKQRLLKASKFFFLLIIIYSLWIALLIVCVYFFLLEDNWAILTVAQWILSAIVLICIAICLEIILVIYFVLSKKKQPQFKKQNQPTLLDGKLVHSYTIPINTKGGIFSKTYILIDEKRILNLRYQMILPSDLWEQKQ